MNETIVSKYDLNECVSWIIQQNCYNVALQFDYDALQDATTVLDYLKKNTGLRREYYLIISECCGIDYLSSLHLGDSFIDGIVKFGNTCLAPLPSTVKDLDVLFAFGSYIDEEDFEFAHNFISTSSESESKLILYDTKYCALVKKIVTQNVTHKLSLGKLKSYSHFWSFTSSATGLIEKSNFFSNDDIMQFKTNPSLDDCDRVIYVGSKISLALRMSCYKKLTQIDLSKRCIQEFNSNKELRKRISLIEKVKQKSNLNVGFLITNSIPCVDWCLEKIKKLKKKHHRVHKIVLVQSTDEFKLGNFSELDAYVLINSCNCSHLIDSIKLHIPILSLKEYEIVCGYRVKYGGTEWNFEEENEIDGTENDNEIRDPEDQLMQLMKVDNLLKQFWYGLQVNPGLSAISHPKEGQTGIAGGYFNEGRQL